MPGVLRLMVFETPELEEEEEALMEVVEREIVEGGIFGVAFGVAFGVG